MASETLSSGAVRPELTFGEYLTLITILDLRAVALRERIEYWRTTDADKNRDFIAWDETELHKVEGVKQTLTKAAYPNDTTTTEKGA